MKSNVTENDIKKSCDNFQRILYYAIKITSIVKCLWISLSLLTSIIL